MKKRTNLSNGWKVAIILMAVLAIGFVVYTILNPWPSSADLNPPSSEESASVSKVPETVDPPVSPKLPETLPAPIPGTTVDDQDRDENKSELEEITSKPGTEETSSKPADKPKEEKPQPEPQVDTQAPVITWGKDIEWFMEVGEKVPTFVATAHDEHDGSVKVIITHDIAFDTVGKYTVTATATDKAGNTSTLTHVFEVKCTPPKQEEKPKGDNQNSGNNGENTGGGSGGGGTVTPPPVDPPVDPPKPPVVTPPEVSEGTGNDNGGGNTIIGGGGLPGDEVGGLPNESVSGGGLPPETSTNLPPTEMGGLPQEVAGQSNSSGNSVADSNATSEPTAQQSDSAENEQMTV